MTQEEEEDVIARFKEVAGRYHSDKAIIRDWVGFLRTTLLELRPKLPEERLSVDDA